MKRPLRILHLEDEADFSELVRNWLSEEFTIDIVRVCARQAFEEAALSKKFDIILADYLLPDYDGIKALKFARANCPEIPFLVVSGAIKEGDAIAVLEHGATDYVLKNFPERLLPAVKRALREASERNVRKRIERQLQRQEQRFQIFTENAHDVLAVLDADGVVTYVSPSVRTVLGFTPSSLIGASVWGLVHKDDQELSEQGLKRLLDGSVSEGRRELRLAHKTEGWRYVEAVVQNRLQDSRIKGIVINFRDVTLRKQAEHELRQSEEQWRLVFDGNPNPMWIFDHDTLNVMAVNDSALRHYGYSRGEFLSLSVRDLRADDTGPTLLEYFHKLIGDKPWPSLDRAGYWRHRKKDGNLIDVEVKWSPVVFKGKKAFLALANDITERKKVEHRDTALSQLSQRLNSASRPIEAAQIIRSVADVLFRWDVFTLNLCSEKDLIPVLNIDTGRDGKRFEFSNGMLLAPGQLSRRAIEKGPVFILRPDPPVMDQDATPLGDTSRPSASLMLVPIRNRTKVIGVLSIQSYTVNAYDAQDLQTLQSLADSCGGALERIGAEEALRESEQQFRDLFQASPDAVVVQSMDGLVLDVNPAACQLHAADRQDLVGRRIVELFPESTRPTINRSLAEFADGTLRQFEGAVLTADSQEVPVEIRASRVNYNGKPSLLLHVRDITERRKAEAALHSSEKLFHSVWENSVDGMRLTDENGVIVAVNQAFCQLVGISRKELENQPFTTVYAPSENLERILRRYRERFASRICEKQVERQLTLRNGNVIVLEDTSSFVEQKGRRPLLLSLFRDVTVQRRLQDQLRQSQKMEAIGQLAGGVAHDFNNILTVIHGHASLLLQSAGQQPTGAKSAQQIILAAERAAGLTRQLLTFGRRQVMQPKRLDLNTVVTHMSRMLGRILGEDITLKLDYSPVPATVLADAGMIEQVLLNLAVNSRDAMPDGGVLEIRIGVVEVSGSHLLKQPQAQPGTFVCLTAQDTGCGIPAENLRRIFEPFFTTKEVGKGTGLGLATVYGIVNQHQGWIEVDSTPGHGAEFRVYLPFRQETPERIDEGAPQQQVPGGRETILVVEDEEPVRELVCSVLLQKGYRVLKAESGPRALVIWQTHRQAVDLLLTDLIMPDRMNGRELAERLVADRPDLKVMFTTGYSMDVLGKELSTGPGWGYLQKPYHPDHLAKAVRDCLDSVLPKSK